MIKNVYVSYTRELAQYVKVAKEAVEGLGLEPLIFEEYGKNYPNLSPNEMMREHLGIADAFVGIYARRYGGIPSKDFEGQPNTEEKSYIDLEYSTACALGIPRLIFLLRDDVEWPVEWVEAEPKASKLRAFITRIMDNELVTFYDSYNALMISLLMRLGNLIRITPMFGHPSPDAQYRRDIFMVMPFAETFRPVYDDHIKKVIEARGLSVKRGDDFFANHAIIQDIWAAIARCRLVVGDCTGQNPNVFYELGIAHTLGKPTVLISQKIEDVPFDVRHLRLLKYENTPAGLASLEAELDACLETVLRLPPR
ncbi:MAG: DUF4062 domain-containing protein [Anaerolineae bacterium]|nr:DUF4062 domain-containing protein [Anaerolineae bacterium]